MWLPVLLAALGMGEVATPVREAAVTEACAAWMSERASDGPPVHTVGDDGLCFFGSTNDANSTAFVEAVSALDPETPLVVVVRSNGGEVNAGMAMAEALVPRATTVVAHHSCISSCANYLFLAGDRRVIATNALLAYHGGVDDPEGVEQSIADMREGWAKEMSPEEVDRMSDGLRTYMSQSLVRQTTFLSSVGADENFFGWMLEFNDLGTEGMLDRCAAPARIREAAVDPEKNVTMLFVFADVLFAEHGIVIDANGGPTTAAATQSLGVERFGERLVFPCYREA